MQVLLIKDKDGNIQVAAQTQVISRENIEANIAEGQALVAAWEQALVDFDAMGGQPVVPAEETPAEEAAEEAAEDATPAVDPAPADTPAEPVVPEQPVEPAAPETPADVPTQAAIDQATAAPEAPADQAPITVQ